MSETPKNYEPGQAPEVRLFQVVKVHYQDGAKRCVIVLLHEDGKSVDTCTIENEGVEDEERLGTGGTTYLESITPTDEIWERSRVINGLVRSGYNREGVERITPYES